MSDPTPEDYAVPPWQIALIFLVVLGGVGLGSLVVIRTETPGQAQPMHMVGREAAAQRAQNAAPDEAALVRAAEAAINDHSWTNGMVYIPPGAFWMGDEGGHPDESPCEGAATPTNESGAAMSSLGGVAYARCLA